MVHLKLSFVEFILFQKYFVHKLKKYEFFSSLDSTIGLVYLYSHYCLQTGLKNGKALISCPASSVGRAWDS